MDIFDSLKRDIGEDKVYKASEAPIMEVVSTGIAGLDYAIGVGGIPRGTLVEIYGRESVGKTALAYYLISAHQRAISAPDRGVAFVNLEGNFDARWAKQISGLNLDKLLIVAPKPGSEAVEVTAKLVNSNGLDLVVFDSIGAMVGDKEMEPGEKKQAGGQSALVTQMVKMILVPAYQNRCTVVFLNQVRDVFSAMYPMEESPGGHAAKHAAAMRFYLKPGKDKIEQGNGEDKVQIMYRVTCKIKKNKVGAPNRTAAWNFWNYPSPDGILGIDTTQDTFDLALKLGTISQGGKYFYHDLFPDGRIISRSSVMEYMRLNPAIVSEIKKEVVSKAVSTRNISEREVLTDV